MNIGRVFIVTKDVKTRRRYDNTRRREQAEETRRAVVESARDLFVRQGYQRTTIAQVAAQADVNPDTVYSVVGRKPELMRELVEQAISGQDRAVPAEERDYVQRLQQATTAPEKIRIYADAVATIQGRLAPVFLTLRDAAAADQDCRNLWAEISQRRAANMRLLAADIRATGELRVDLTDDEVADILWSMNAAEYWDLLVTQRGWTAERFGRWLADAWSRLLLSTGES